jgi:hypothetical protein
MGYGTLVVHGHIALRPGRGDARRVKVLRGTSSSDGLRLQAWEGLRPFPSSFVWSFKSGEERTGKSVPQGLKPGSLLGLCGPTKVVP